MSPTEASHKPLLRAIVEGLTILLEHHQSKSPPSTPNAAAKPSEESKAKAQSILERLKGFDVETNTGGLPTS